MEVKKWSNIFPYPILQGEIKTFIETFIKSKLNINALNEEGHSLLSYAAKYGTLEIVKYLVLKGADCNVKNSNGCKPLHIASEYGHKDIVEFFFNIGVPVDSCDYNKWTPLHYAAVKGNIEIVEFLRNKSDLDVTTNIGDTPLLLAAKNWNEDIVELLIKSRADVKICNNKKWTLLHYASREGWLKIVKLIVNEFDLNVKTSDGDTPLLLAADQWNKDIVELLIKSGADIKCYNSKKWTLLHYACVRGWLNEVQFIVNKESDLNSKTINGDTPLLLAINKWRKDIIKLLIKSGADIKCCNNKQWTILHYASFRGLLDEVQFFINKECDLNVKTSDGDTPLLLAADKYHKDVVKLLIKSGADIKCCNNKKWSLIHYVSFGGWLEEVQFIVNKEFDINVKTCDGDTPLLLAADKWHKDAVELLIKFGADVNGCNNNKWTLLHYASCKGWLDVVQFVVNKVIDLNAKISDGNTPLLLAAENWNEEIIELLIKSGADVNVYNNRKWTLLHYASREGWLEIVHLIVNESDLNAKTSDGDLPILLAADQWNQDVVALLMVSGADINCCNNKKWTVLHYACSRGWLDEVQFIVNKEPDLNSKTTNGDTPLLLAINKWRKDIIKLLIKSGADIKCCNNKQWTILHYASFRGLLDEVQFFINKECDLNVKTSDGDTPLLLAADKYHKDVVKLLIKSGADVRCYNNKKWTLIHFASFGGWLEEVQFIVDKEFDLNVETCDGDTPLLLAADKWHKDTVELLIKFGADVNSCNNNKWTLFHHASCKGWLEVVQFVVNKVVDLNAKTSDGNTPLLLAAENWNEEIIELLIKFGADLKVYNNRKWTLLHYASREGWLEIVQLIVNESDLNAKTSDGDTPLLLAADQWNEETVELLLKSGADVNDCNINKWTLLHYVSCRGWLEVVQYIVNKEPDLNAKTSDGDTPIMLAADQSHIDIVELLIKSGADVKCYNNKKWSLFHYAACRGWLQVVQFIVNKEPNLNTKTSDGDTPLLLAAEFWNRDIFEFLMKSGADVNCYNNSKSTVLHHAARCQWLEVVLAFMKAGANINAQNSQGNTPLNIACQTRNIELIKCLLKEGADCNIKNKVDNETAFNYIVKNMPSVEAISLFVKHGAYFKPIDYLKIYENPLLKDPILRDIQLCTQTIINEFNNKHLIAVYRLPGFLEKLPPIEQMKVANNRSVAHEIQKSVECEILTRGHCNLMEARFLSLKMLSVKALIDRQINLKRSMALDFKNPYQFSNKKKRLN